MNPWQLYDELIDGVPEDIVVRDYYVGKKWTYVEADCGFGIAFTTIGGLQIEVAHQLTGMSLKEVAALSKSWHFESASIGVAALNAWYSQPERVEALGATLGAAAFSKSKDSARFGIQMEVFERAVPEIEAHNGEANVVVVGHFPSVEKLDEICNLTILERKCRDEWDTPDPACEFVMPNADFAFITGATFVNKTAPRLIELAQNAKTVMVGPTVVPAEALFSYGVDCINGDLVVDSESAKRTIRAGEKFDAAALQTFTINKE